MRTRTLFPFLVLLLLVVSLSSVQTSFAEGINPTCQPHTLEVTLLPGDPTQYTLYGELCGTGDTVQLLVHGATYNHTYWDWQYYQPEHYSYVQHATARGYATFNIDRLGAGYSDAPNGYFNGVDANAYVIHQVVQALRAGTFGTAFGRVVLVGHSFGSMMSVAEASQYHDVDAVVLTGFAHNLNPEFAQAGMTMIYPAEYDPKFAGSGLVNYFTTVPGTRGYLFYNADLIDPNVIALDEQNKDVVALALLLEQGRFYSTESLGINVPVYLVLGDQDLIFCGPGLDCSSAATVAAHEAAYFSPAACLQTDLIQQTGHNLNLHYNADQTFARILAWVDQTGRNGCP